MKLQLAILQTHTYEVMRLNKTFKKIETSYETKNCLV